MSRVVLSLLALISPVFAQDQGGQSSIVPLVIMIGMFVVMYLIIVRPQQKRVKEHKKLVDALKVGDEIMLHSGIVGRITHLGENFVKLEIANNVEVKTQRQAIGSLLPKGSFKGDLD